MHPFEPRSPFSTPRRLAAALAMSASFIGCGAAAPEPDALPPRPAEATAPAARVAAPERRHPARTSVSVEEAGEDSEAMRAGLQSVAERIAAHCAPPNAGLLRVVFEKGRLASVEVWPEAAREPGTHACVVEQIAVANLEYLRAGADGEPLPASVLIRVEW